MKKKIPQIEASIMTQYQRELRKHLVKAETFIQSEKLFCLGNVFSYYFLFKLSSSLVWFVFSID